ncbi:hypothetical protein EA770_01310 [Acinetobacter baumannii]|uniref:Uncharacterized protein n=1 Tax=Acinetobacter courvalinii TaxID=280147 RepID=A0ABD0A5L7_9GAMM|nr:hypothetical protein F7P77_11655 [Acinetobacter courvalinii]RSN84227.1 hypothetical protein EA770_01310 [Acinetobacter baumannii]GGH30129.1 hypothetical protein GCM10007354_10020 [Acinetobacter courvalinii]
MKNALLILLGRYKLFCTISTGSIVFLSIIYACNFNSISVNEIIVLIIAWLFFLTIIWNVSYVYAPSINNDSNIYDIVSRWGLIIISLIILMYSIFNICF